MPQTRSHCTQCTTPSTYAPAKLGELLFPGSGNSPLRSLAQDDIAKGTEGQESLQAVLDAVMIEGVKRPLVLVKRPEGLEVVHGGFHAWAAFQLDESAPVLRLQPSCRECTVGSLVTLAVRKEAEARSLE